MVLDRNDGIINIFEIKFSINQFVIDKKYNAELLNKAGVFKLEKNYKENKVLSPSRLEFSSYERFMKNKGINGIGNMIGYSLESSCKLIQIHLDNHIGGESVSNFKSRMYQTMYPELEPRLRSYGWEHHKTNSFNLIKYKIELIKQLRPTIPVIKWNNTIKTLLNTSATENDKFN